MKNNRQRVLVALLAGLLAAATAWGFAYVTNSSTGLPVKWPSPAYPLRIMLGTNPGGTIDYAAAAQAAAQDWNAIIGAIQFQGTVATGTATDRNRVNELVFAANIFGEAFDTNTLAVTTTWRLGNDRTEGDIIFNSARNWGAYNGPTQSGLVDLKRVALHELGHALGLDHPDEAGQTFSPPLPIMNSRITSNDTLTPDDVTAAQNLYGPPGTPPNNNFANATAITLANNAATVTGYNTNATKEPGEPNHADNAGGRSVWWKWTAPSAGSVTADTRGSYSDTTLGVYTGNSVNALTTIASNDDINRGIVQASTVTFNATGGVTYFFAVDGFDGDVSGLTLNLAFTQATGTLPTITAQPVSATVTAGASVVFSVTATAGASPVTYQWQFNGANLVDATSSSLSLVASSANAGTYAVIVSTTAGSVSSNTVTLTVNAAPPPPPPPPPPSSGGRGGGGAPSLWFWGALSLLGLARFLRRR
ncbi:MAG: matrixin family metalloprotease [Opitutae bacterium]|nr:matrixin family metalloprotease [Opitutae bacterium]